MTKELHDRPDVIPSAYVRKNFELHKYAGRPCVLIDIDGTLADNTQRAHMIENKQWTAFYEAMGEDAVFYETLYLMNCMRERDDMILVMTTGRPSSYSDKTIKWLAEINSPHHMLLMRYHEDKRSDVDVKRDMIKAVRRVYGLRPFFAIEDRPEVVAMMRSHGMKVFQPDPSAWFVKSPMHAELIAKLDVLQASCAFGAENQTLRECRELAETTRMQYHEMLDRVERHES